MRTSIKMMLCGLFATVTSTLFSGVAMACSSSPYVGGMCLFAGNFAIRDWARAEGQLLPIDDNTALFSLVGTTYGGDGRTTFGLPDLRGRTPIGVGSGPGLNNITWGQKGGQEAITLTLSNLPSHTHGATTTVAIENDTSTSNAVLKALAAPADTNDPTGNVLADSPARENIYNTGLPTVDMSPNAIVLDVQVTSTATATTTVTNTGGSSEFNIRNPYLGMTWLIALTGVYPSRS
ncbi:phage tail protein [Alteromonas sp. ASW11-130]|uniref:phage tail protein n=1 Tax=Alteromonas sp. ASW11-130 TaxID=3015775 RepID=UPI002242BDD5|nr:tail fiber protein [Alteromonas sp. ASW11-130]MCW8092721.1 tail fiber protein [Alteromonas sp. ASW11-130]